MSSGTTTENIAMGKPGATKDEVVAAAKMSNAHDCHHGISVWV
jgi:ABC-type multidrug transport system fused ATPase/permease subunit